MNDGERNPGAQVQIRQLAQEEDQAFSQRQLLGSWLLRLDHRHQRTRRLELRQEPRPQACEPRADEDVLSRR
jgi:hypothetical protein